MTTKTILAVIIIATGMILSTMAGGEPTQYVHAAKEKCTTYEFESTGETQSICAEQGKDPTVSTDFCSPVFGCFHSEGEVTHKEAAEVKTGNLQRCKQVVDENEDDGISCSTK
jgi:hypothetical protein